MNEYPKPHGKKWIETMLDKAQELPFHATVVLKETGEFVGDIRVRSPNRKNRDGDLGVMLAKDQRDKGYGGEAVQYVIDLMFRSFGMHRVSLSVYEANSRALALYKKLWVHNCLYPRSSVDSNFQRICRRREKTKGQLGRWKMAG